jgi:hypothetical protein
MNRAHLLLSHPAHFIALGFGAGLSPVAPGTVGTLWAWATYGVLQSWLSPAEIGVVIAVSLLVGWWACTVSAENMGVADPGAIVWGRSGRLLAGAVALDAGQLLGTVCRVCLVPIFRCGQTWTGRLGRPGVQRPWLAGRLGYPV